MRDFDRYSKEFFISTNNFSLERVMKSYQLPNSIYLHNMICGYKNMSEYEDSLMFEDAESIDYFNYEKALWNLEKPRT